MYKWSNIEADENDSEIELINSMESSLKPLPRNIFQIRELITRLEICHFKCREHIGHIKESILELSPYIIPENIGICHIRNGEAKSCKEQSGRSIKGQKYIWALKKWLNPRFYTQNIKYDVEFNYEVFEYLGKRNPLKDDLVRMLIARLTWDWKALKELSYLHNQSDLEAQISRVDICHHNFPDNINKVLVAIGKNRAADDFMGCGLFSDEIKTVIMGEFLDSCKILKAVTEDNKDNGEKAYKVWLTASLMKTLKEQIELDIDISELLILD